jgi:hypothetical protein
MEIFSSPNKYFMKVGSLDPKSLFTLLNYSSTTTHIRMKKHYVKQIKFVHWMVRYLTIMITFLIACK